MTAQANLSFEVTGLNCASCAGRAERALAAVSGVSEASVNLADARARVTGVAPSGDLVVALNTVGYPAAQTTTDLRLDGMSCASCVGRLERLFSEVPGVLSVHINLAEGSARLRHLQGSVTAADLQRVASDAGYPAQVLSAAGDAPVVDQGAETRNLILALLLAVPLLLMEMGGHLYPPLHHALHAAVGEPALLSLQFVLCSLLLIGPGRRFFTSGVPALLRGAPDMNTLVATGTFAAWGYSTLAVFAPGLFPPGSAQVYFEAAGVVTALVLLGRWLETRAKGRTGAAIRALMDLSPPQAEVIAADGHTNTVPLDQVQPGMQLRLRPGAKVPADGVVLSGQSAVDESMMTGEPLAVQKTAGDPLTAGCVNGAGVLDMEVEAAGAETRLAQIIALVRDAQGAKLPVQAVVDRVTLWFVPAVMGLAAATVLLWLLITGDPARALVAGVCVLIIACPCAMGLATPTSVMVALGRAARLGVLFRRGDALQRLGELRCIVFDKTGTLTEGRPALAEVRLAEGEDSETLLRQVASLEARSEHPLARAFEGLDASEPFSEVEAVAGLGLRGQMTSGELLIGSHKFLEQEGVDTQGFGSEAARWAALWAGQGAGVIHVARAGHQVAVLSVRDPLRAEAAGLIAQLKQMNVVPVMITGDAQATAQAVAQELGLAEVHADCLPEDKHRLLGALKTRYGAVGFVGDGINDAPALAAADVGVALGAGTDVAVEAADVVLTREGLWGVVHAHALSTAAMRNIRQNLLWAFGYNVALIPVAAGLLVPLGGPMLSPALGGAAMALSSVFVVTNALRLGRFAPKL